MNEHQLKQQAMEAQRRRFLTALSAGQIRAVDRYNRTIEVGQVLLIKLPVDPEFEVTAISPNLDPNAPSGLLTVTVQTTIPLMIQANVPWSAAIILKERARDGDTSKDGTKDPSGASSPTGSPALQVVRPDRNSADESEREAEAAGGGTSADPGDPSEGVGPGCDVPVLPRDANGEPID